MRNIHIMTMVLLSALHSQEQRQTRISQADYYESAYKLYGTALRSALHDIIKNHTVVSYDALWTHFQTTDKKPNGKVWDMYSDVPGGTPPYEYTFVTQQCGNYSVEGDCYNREHSWPKSWFNDVSPPYSDLFHLFPTDGKVNGIRNNYNYGNVTSPTITSKNGSKLGPNTFPGYSGVVFEPVTAYKGDLARGHFYMSVRYFTEDAAWSSSNGTNKSDILPWYSNLLFSWHSIDPVSIKEINRNNSVFGIQKNRNPFIDHPEFAAEIWQTSTAPKVESILQNSSSSIIIDFTRYIDSISAVSKGNIVIGQSVGNPVSVAWGVNNDISKILLTVPPLPAGITYSVQLKNMKSINNIAMSDTVVSFTSAIVSRAGQNELSSHLFMLEQNYPNPFNPATVLRYTIPASGYTTLNVYNTLGKEIALLVDERKEAGTHQIQFNAKEIPGGVYFYRLQSGRFTDTRIMLYLK